MLPPPRRMQVDPIDVTLLIARAKVEEAETLETVFQQLSAQELAMALGDAPSLDRLVTMSR
jgi:hypothetical protein